MNEGQISGRLSWLTATLAAGRTNISQLLSRLKGIAMSAGTNIALHRKFMRLMNQVANIREKELDILHEIETVEKRHSELRRRNLLRKADPEAAARTDLIPEEQEQDEEKPQRLSLLTLAGILYFLSARSSKVKQLEPTVE